MEGLRSGALSEQFFLLEHRGLPQSGSDLHTLDQCDECQGHNHARVQVTEIICFPPCLGKTLIQFNSSHQGTAGNVN